MSEKIFVSIGSYKDPMIVRTIKSLLTRAENPQNIRIVVLDQVGFSPDEQRPQNSKNVEVVTVGSNISSGVSWARSQIESKYDGEKYYLEIDSHSLCNNGWDTFYKGLLDRLREDGSDKPVLSSPPPKVEWDENNKQNDFEQYQCFRWQFDSYPEEKSNYQVYLKKEKSTQRQCIQVPWIDTRCIFSYGDRIKDVPHNPKTYGDCVVDDLSLRLFTNGYDVFSSHVNPIGHYYTKKQKHFEDFHESKGIRNSHFLNQRSVEELRKLVNGKKKYGKLQYGLGEVRTLNEFKKLSGVSYDDK